MKLIFRPGGFGLNKLDQPQRLPAQERKPSTVAARCSPVRGTTPDTSSPSQGRVPTAHMAAMGLLRRISGALSRRTSAPIADFRGFLCPTHATLMGAAAHTQAKPGTDVSEGDAPNDQVCSSVSTTSAPKMSHLVDKDSDVKYRALSNLKTSSRHDLAMVFTCKVCETRSVKTACRESYEKGIVVVKCGGCNNLHLIADRLGWFGEPGSVEEFLKARGEDVKKGSAESLNLTLDDIVGTKLST